MSRGIENLLEVSAFDILHTSLFRIWYVEVTLALKLFRAILQQFPKSNHCDFFASSEEVVDDFLLQNRAFVYICIIFRTNASQLVNFLVQMCLFIKRVDVFVIGISVSNTDFRFQHTRLHFPGDKAGNLAPTHGVILVIITLIIVNIVGFSRGHEAEALECHGISSRNLLIIFKGVKLVFVVYRDWYSLQHLLYKLHCDQLVFLPRVGDALVILAALERDLLLVGLLMLVDQHVDVLSSIDLLQTGHMRVVAFCNELGLLTVACEVGAHLICLTDIDAVLN